MPGVANADLYFGNIDGCDFSFEQRDYLNGFETQMRLARAMQDADRESWELGPICRAAPGRSFLIVRHPRVPDDDYDDEFVYNTTRDGFRAYVYLAVSGSCEVELEHWSEGSGADLRRFSQVLAIRNCSSQDAAADEACYRAVLATGEGRGYADAFCRDNTRSAEHWDCVLEQTQAGNTVPYSQGLCGRIQ